jgi:hypothetical protein
MTWWRMSRDVSERSVGLHDLRRCSKIDLALVVHHVVELQQVLADVEVARLDLPCARSSALLIQGWTIASPSSGRASAASSPCARTRRCASGRLRATGRTASGRGRPGGRSGRAAGCRCAGSRGARCRGRRGRRRPAPAPWLAATSPRSPRRGGDLGRDRRGRCAVLGPRPPGHAHVDVAAELDVGAAAGHVGGDGHAPGTPAWATMWASCSW